MPCTKCEEGKYKWGETGECKYDSLEACESANTKYNKMQPTPLGKKTYEEYEKELKEFNLSSQRVELGAIDDLNSLVKEFTSKIVPKYDKIVKEQDDWIKMGNNLKSKAENEYKAYNKNEQARLKILGLIEKQAKELGINPLDIKEVKKAVQVSDSNARIYKTYESIKKIKV
jgi:hypothetical protein